jgi:hypothetical protein
VLTLAGCAAPATRPALPVRITGAFVDGEPHTLPPGSRHIFSDSQYAGSRDLRLPTP